MVAAAMYMQWKTQQLYNCHSGMHQRSHSLWAEGCTYNYARGSSGNRFVVHDVSYTTKSRTHAKSCSSSDDREKLRRRDEGDYVRVERANVATAEAEAATLVTRATTQAAAKDAARTLLAIPDGGGFYYSRT